MNTNGGLDFSLSGGPSEAEADLTSGLRGASEATAASPCETHSSSAAVVSRQPEPIQRRDLVWQPIVRMRRIGQDRRIEHEMPHSASGDGWAPAAVPDRLNTIRAPRSSRREDRTHRRLLRISDRLRSHPNPANSESGLRSACRVGCRRPSASKPTSNTSCSNSQHDLIFHALRRSANWPTGKQAAPVRQLARLMPAKVGWLRWKPREELKATQRRPSSGGSKLILMIV